jgi:3-deoxy-D-manno-octulosonate 8-phosphate phosphatase (KDO 8-P phosphatase)
VTRVSPTQLRRRAAKIRLIAMDVDGVLTDGKIVIRASGEEIKEWNVKDRIGFFMLKHTKTPIHLAWITGRKSAQVEARAKEIGAALHQGCENKGRALEETAKHFGVTLQETAFLGDDLIDLPAFARAGLAVSPADGHAEAKASAHWVTKAKGGEGVFREVADTVLKARDEWSRVIDHFRNPA